MIEIDDNGDFVVNGSGNLKTATRPNSQSAKAEMRCQQGSWYLNLNYGRNLLVWTISQSSHDRCVDLTRIAAKYVTVGSVVFNSVTKVFDVQVLSND
jgi:hypothetical protein